MATVDENCKICRPPDSMPEFSLPMVFFDMLWHGLATYRGVLFFKIPCSRSHFVDAILPELKKSLSLTFGQFLPLAGNIIHPLNPGDKPILRYQSGDSVCFTVSESSADFNHLTGDNPRDCDEFYAFAPQLPPPTRSDISISFPVLALHVTLFPGQGLCIGFVANHGVADASTVVSFFHAWALINRTKPRPENICEALLTEGNCLPFFDRKAVMNLKGLDSIYWEKLIAKFPFPVEPPPVKVSINKVQTTFVLKKGEIEKLKNLVLSKCSGGVAHLSSFTVACELVMVCSAKSGGEEVVDDEPEYLCLVADCRERLKPPLPANYFGNCLALVKAELKHGQAKGPEGFVMAAKAIGEAIKENVNNEKGGILCGAENWPEEFEKVAGKRRCTVYGSPRFDFYAADYGWGKPKKFDTVFVEDHGSFSLSKSRDFEGGLEIGLSKPMVQMDVFSRVFSEVLSDLLQ